MTESSREGRWGSQPLAENVVKCPAWCVLAGREPHRALLPDEYHQGPDFGIFGTSGEIQPDGSVAVTASSLAVGDLTPDRLRKVAADALAAADWLEALRTVSARA